MNPMGARYSIYEAKAKLSEIIRIVKKNRSVVITERGKEVARVVPVEEPQTAEARIAEFERLGIIQPATADPREVMRPIARRPGTLAQLFADRESRDRSLRRHIGSRRRAA